MIVKHFPCSFDSSPICRPDGLHSLCHLYRLCRSLRCKDEHILNVGRPGTVHFRSSSCHFASMTLIPEYTEALLDRHEGTAPMLCKYESISGMRDSGLLLTDGDGRGRKEGGEERARLDDPSRAEASEQTALDKDAQTYRAFPDVCKCPVHSVSSAAPLAVGIFQTAPTILHLAIHSRRQPRRRAAERD